MLTIIPYSSLNPPSPATTPKVSYLLVCPTRQLRSSIPEEFVTPVCCAPDRTGSCTDPTILRLTAERKPESLQRRDEIPSTEKRNSNMPSRYQKAKKQFCPDNLMACEMSGIALQDGRSPKSLACIDTQTDIEACGGCPFAGPDSVQGEDCTDMQGVDEVIVSTNSPSLRMTPMLTLVSSVQPRKVRSALLHEGLQSDGE
jgi:hypothetical protein